MARLPALLIALALGAAALGAARAAPAADTAADPALEARVNTVAAELRCLVCQNQSLADSHAGLAIDLKNQVREQLRSGRSPDQVVAFMTERYGDFVLYRPPLKTTTILLWLGPALLLAAAAGLLWHAIGRARRAGPAPALSDEDQGRAAALLGTDRPSH